MRAFYLSIHPSVYLYIYLCSASEIYPERGGERDRDRRGRGARRAAGGGVSSAGPRTPFIYLSIQQSISIYLYSASEIYPDRR